MLKQIRQLTSVQLRSLFGINEALHTKDKKKRNRFLAMAAVWLLLIFLLLFYTTILANAFVEMGMAEIVPIYLAAITSLMILFFSFFKAPGVIFQMSTYEMLSALPVSKSAIVISRFLTMYVTNIIMSLIIMLPGIAVYAKNIHPTGTFYFYGILGTILLPLLPITAATAIGALITGISSRMKHKNLISSLLTVVFAIAIIISSMVLPDDGSKITEQAVKNIASILTKQIGKIYPPAIWFGRAAVDGSIKNFLLFAGVSILVFVLLIAVLQKYFMAICSALNVTSAKNNYKLRSLQTNSLLKALWKKEIKRYFASSIYVSNTLIGYLLMDILAVAIFIVGPQKVEAAMQIPHIIQKILPLLLGLTASIMPITSCSISLEGKQFWMIQTLPVKSKDVFDSKILLNLTIAFPCYLIAVIFGCLAIKPNLLEAVWLLLLPAVYIVFTAVAGITVNLAMPVFDWENEVRVVKQSASTMITMLTGFVAFLVPLICMFLFKSVSYHIIMGITGLLLALLTVLLYTKNNKKRLISL